MSARELPTARKTLVELARQHKRAPGRLLVQKDSVTPLQPAGPRSFRFTLSTARVDRAGDVVRQVGWDLAAYKRNPVVLLDHGCPPVLGNVPIGRGIDVRLEGGELRGTVVLDEETVPVSGPFAAMVKAKLLNGSLTACSVGFRPIDFDLAPGRGDFGPGFDFKSQELTEWSVVAVPCNPDSLVDDASGMAQLVSNVAATAPRGARKMTAGAFLRRLDLEDRFA